jgi:hypothetical protein
VPYPKELITNTSFVEALIRKLPAASVTVPLFAPLTTTDTRGTPSFVLSTTRPVTVLWARMVVLRKRKKIKIGMKVKETAVECLFMASFFVRASYGRDNSQGVNY